MTDTLQSNILTVDAQGNVGVVLQGGITIPVTETDPPSFADAVTFERGNGTNAGQIYLDDAGGPAITLKATADPSALAPASVGIRLSGSGGSATALLLEDNGASSFLQLATAQKLQLAEGSGTWTWPGGSTNSGTATISHGLGRAPRRVFIEPTVPANWVLHLATNRTATSFDTTAQFPSFTPGAGYAVTFDWIAIG